MYDKTERDHLTFDMFPPPEVDVQINIQNAIVALYGHIITVTSKTAYNGYFTTVNLHFNLVLQYPFIIIEMFWCLEY